MPLLSKEPASRTNSMAQCFSRLWVRGLERSLALLSERGENLLKNRSITLAVRREVVSGQSAQGAGVCGGRELS